MITGIACGVACFFAFALFVRERRLWHRRQELDGVLFQYSRRRYLRRALGCLLLGVTMVMTFLGLEVLDFTDHLTAFQIYWALVGLFTLSLLVLPFLDMRETYKHLAHGGAEERLRIELERFQAQLRAKQAQGGARGEGPSSQKRGPANTGGSH